MINLTEISSFYGLGIALHVLASILKYFLVAGVAYLLFYVWKYRQWFIHKIQQRMPSNKELWHELSWSILSRLIFSGIILIIIPFMDASQVYFEVSEYGIPYLVASTIGLIFFHDTYFYWIHWLMHKPSLYRHVHRVHHHSVNPTPLASFSFHPSEALLEVAIFPVLLFLVPLHPIAIGTLIIFQLLFNAYGHSGFELMPRWWVSNPISKYINTSTHHNLHHKEFHYNLGLYFNHWDRWMGTLDPEYEKKFYAIKDRKKENQPQPQPLHHQPST